MKLVLLALAFLVQGRAADSALGQGPVLDELSPEEFPAFADDLSSSSLEAAAAESLGYYEKGDGAGRTFPFGTMTVSAKEMAETIRLFLKDFRLAKDPGRLGESLRRDFKVFRIDGSAAPVLFTGYYEPEMDASLRKAGPFIYPLYSRPPDLVSVEMESFRPSARGERIWGRIQDGKLVPYLSREEIDFGGALDGKGLELAWVKSRWEALDAQIEGSTVLILPDGRRVRALFEASNGLPFVSPVRALTEKGLLRKDQQSGQAAREFLDRHPELEREVFSADKRYAFFRLEEMKDGGPLGTMKSPLVAGRSIAVDNRIFPLGGLAYYSVPLPREGGGSAPARRFALMQDTGGAILGPGRADIFLGRGRDALAVAGRVKAEGSLFLLLKK